MLYVTAAGLPLVFYCSSPLYLRHASQSAAPAGSRDLFTSPSGDHAH